MQCKNRITRSTRILGILACNCLFWCACSRDETTLPSPETAPPAATAPAAPVGVDAQDDPQAPRSLPDSNELSGWVKSEPIHRVQPDQLPMVRNHPAAANALRSYPIDHAWACAYTKDKQKVFVSFIETADPLDAFGLFSVFTRLPGTGFHSPDRILLELNPTPGGATVASRQGKTFILLEASGIVSPDKAESVEHLARKILFSIPATDTPLIMRAIPKALLLNGKAWMVRRTAPLGTTLEELKPIATAGLDETLGLTGREKLWIAAVEKLPDVQTAATKPASQLSLKHLIWIVEYTAEDDARKAYTHYQQRLSSPVTDLDRDTRVHEPRGTYLAGTWTAGAEASAPILPDLDKALSAAAEMRASHSLGRSTTRPAAVPR